MDVSKDFILGASDVMQGSITWNFEFSNTDTHTCIGQLSHRPCQETELKSHEQGERGAMRDSDFLRSLLAARPEVAGGGVVLELGES